MEATLVDFASRRTSQSVHELSTDSRHATAAPPAGEISASSLYVVDGGEAFFAQGGMGTIWLAQDTTLGRTVVLKVLHEAHRNNPELQERFRREAAITALLQHPGIPPVYCLGSLSDGRPFFSTRLLDGHTLDHLMRDCRDPIRERPRFLTLFEQVCQTVAFAHARGIIHRDLKPANIVVGEYGSVYVMDWGVARQLGPSGGGADRTPSETAELIVSHETLALSALQGAEDAFRDVSITDAGDLLGTPQYMSPEQAAGDPDLDERTDVFSLGVILFEMLTGRPLRPVKSLRLHELADYAKAGHENNLAELDGSRADEPLINLVKRCLDPVPDNRPRNGTEVAAEITAYLQHVLRRPEREMARFFELSPDLFCLAGLDGYFKQINQNFTRVLGYSTEELLSQPVAEYVHPEDREATMAVIVQLAEGRPIVQFENRVRDRWGNYKWFQWAAKAVPEEGIVFAAARDITGRKRLEQRLQVTIESSPVAMVISDREGLIIQLNRAAEQLFGYDRVELLGEPVEVLMPQRFRAGHPGLRRLFHANPTIRPGPGRELWGLRKDGTEIAIELGLSPLEVEEGYFVISTISEITRARRNERRCKALMESFPAGVLMVDDDDVIGAVNTEAERLFGHDSGSLIGQPLSLLFPELPRGGEPRCSGNSCAASSPSPDHHRLAVRGRHRNGEELFVEIEEKRLGLGDHLLVIMRAMESQSAPAPSPIETE